VSVALPDRERIAENIGQMVVGKWAANTTSSRSALGISASAASQRAKALHLMRENEPKSARLPNFLHSVIASDSLHECVRRFGDLVRGVHSSGSNERRGEERVAQRRHHVAAQSFRMILDLCA